MAWLYRGERLYDDSGRCLVIAQRDFDGKSTRWERSDFVFVEADFNNQADRAAINRKVSELRDDAMKYDMTHAEWVV